MFAAQETGKETGMKKHPPDGPQLTHYGQQMVVRWRFLAYKISRKFLDALDKDEAESIALEALCRAVILFNPDYGVKFTTYAWRAIYNTLLQEAEKRKRIRSHESDLSEKVLAVMGTPSPENMGYIEEVLAALLRKLSYSQRRLLERRAHGEPIRDTAKHFGYCKNHVCNRQQEAIRELREIVGGEK